MFMCMCMYITGCVQLQFYPPGRIGEDPRAITDHRFHARSCGAGNGCWQEAPTLAVPSKKGGDRSVGKWPGLETEGRGGVWWGWVEREEEGRRMEWWNNTELRFGVSWTRSERLILLLAYVSAHTCLHAPSLSLCIYVYLPR